MTQHALQLQMVAKTNVGKIREHNEDNFIVTNDVEATWVVPTQPYNNPKAGSVMVVADGMGGMNAGEIASKITIDSIYAFFREKIAKNLSPAERLVAAIQYAHQQILDYARVNLETEGMGTTVVAAHIIHDKLYIAWSGDSRCYLFRGGTLSQLTKDHSYVQTLLDEGKITKTQAFYHPQSNVILQSLGDSERPPTPDVVVEALYQDDIVLLCSDGLNSMIEDHTIESILQHQTEDLTLCADKLIEAANEAGGNDNITVVLNRVVQGSAYVLSGNNRNNTLPDPLPPPKKRISTVVWIALGMTLASVGLIAWFYPELQKVGGYDQVKSTSPPRTDTLPTTPPAETPKNQPNREEQRTQIRPNQTQGHIPQNEKQKNTQTQVENQSAREQKEISSESGELSEDTKVRNTIKDWNLLPRKEENTVTKANKKILDKGEVVKDSNEKEKKRNH